MGFKQNTILKIVCSSSSFVTGKQKILGGLDESHNKAI